MTYNDIFEFQDANKTKEEKIRAFRQMNDEEAKALISTCGTPQGKIFYSKLYYESKK